MCAHTCPSLEPRIPASPTFSPSLSTVSLNHRRPLLRLSLGSPAATGFIIIDTFNAGAFRTLGPPRVVARSFAFASEMSDYFRILSSRYGNPLARFGIREID